MVIYAATGLRGPITQHEERWHSENRPVVIAAPEPPIRTELVARIKEHIAAGIYDTPEKFETAFLEMLRRLDSE